MLEVEVKARADAAVRRVLEERGDPGGTVRQVDVYLHHPSRDLAQSDEAVRVRREEHAGSGEATASLTYKGPRRGGPTKTREEATVEVGDPEDALAVLEHMGFTEAARVVKRRTRYRWEGWTVVWDEVEGLGTYVEVERVVPEPGEGTKRPPGGQRASHGADPVERVVPEPGADVDALEREALELLEAMGAGEPETRSYLELLQERTSGA